MKTYNFQEVQSGNYIIMAVIIATMVVLGTLILVGERQIQGMLVSVITILLMTLVGFSFYQLKTDVSNENIMLKFGIGIIQKRIDLNNVESVRVVRNKWFYGWGIRGLVADGCGIFMASVQWN